MKSKRNNSQGGAIKTVVSVVSLVAMVLAAIQFRLIPRPGCVVKGNISFGSGQKVYHLPGMEDDQSTNIDPGRGERWFCSEAEAIANGWRKAPR